MAKVKDMPQVEEAQNNGQELSKEELAKRREEVSNFYKENLKHLKVQLEYEEHLTMIEKTRAERLQAQLFMAQAYAAQEAGPQEDEGPSAAKVDFDSMRQESKRTLKRES